MDISAPTSSATQDILVAAKRAAAEHLAGNGFTITRWDATGQGAADMEAEREGCRLLAHVRAALQPGVPVSLTSAEMRWMEVRAERAGRMGLLCTLSLASDEKGGLRPANMRWELV